MTLVPAARHSKTRMITRVCTGTRHAKAAMALWRSIARVFRQEEDNHSRKHLRTIALSCEAVVVVVFGMHEIILIPRFVVLRL